MKMRLLLLLLLGSLASSSAAFAEEDLIYAIRHIELNPNGYYNLWTEIFSSKTSGVTRKLFDDRALPFRLTGVPRGDFNVSARATLVNSKRHELITVVNLRGVDHVGEETVYAIPLDDSQRARRLFSIDGKAELADLFVASQGDRVGYVEVINGEHTLYVRSLDDGRLLTKFSLHTWMGECNYASAGFGVDGRSLWINIRGPNGEVDGDSPEWKPAGSWRLSPDGSQAKHLPEMTAEKGRILSQDSLGDQVALLAELTGGRLLYVTNERLKFTKYAEDTDQLVIIGDKNKREAIHLNGVNLTREWFVASPSGNLIAYLEIRRKKRTDTTGEGVAIAHIQSLDGQSIPQVAEAPQRDGEHWLELMGFDER